MTGGGKVSCFTALNNTTLVATRSKVLPTPSCYLYALALFCLSQLVIPISSLELNSSVVAWAAGGRAAGGRQGREPLRSFERKDKGEELHTPALSLTEPLCLLQPRALAAGTRSSRNHD
ncbi:hypothetical protein E2C01_009152 [Portunus trituberculatus]|uniref:Uncharacterized protein n=1 Tax=Portunus trituberculatus TaxID=210409 RepID=A0A5B7D3T5_PORTR|nr:hypothetical protein [Portunus trituberculatus]